MPLVCALLLFFLSCNLRNYRHYLSPKCHDVILQGFFEDYFPRQCVSTSDSKETYRIYLAEMPEAWSSLKNPMTDGSQVAVGVWSGEQIPACFTPMLPLFNSFSPPFNLCSTGNLEPPFGNHGWQTLGGMGTVHPDMLSGPVRDTPPYRAIPFRDSIAEGGIVPICLVFIGYRASIAEIPLLRGGYRTSTSHVLKGEALRKGGGGIAPNWPCWDTKNPIARNRGVSLR